MKEKYTISFNHETLDTVINRLQKLVNIGFSYNPSIVINTLPITKTFNNESLNLILDSILLPNQLTYKIIGTNIAIYRYLKINIKIDSVVTAGLNKYFEVTGKIVDKISKNPIAYANVYISNKAIGTLSNNEGNFILKIPSENKTDSLHISCLGYKAVILPINCMSSDNYLVLLKPVSIYIKEVDVNYVDAIRLIHEAIVKIPINYSNKPLMNTAFYREIICENNEFVNLSEAIISIYKGPYDNYTNDQVAILKGRKNLFVKSMDTLLFKLQGGPSISLLLDIAKNPGIILSDEFIGDYNFKLDDIITMQDRAVYVISFDQKDNIPYSLYKGKLYIDRVTMAFLRADFMISPKGIDYATGLFVRKTPRKVKVRLLSAKYLVDYKNDNNKWHLNDVRQEMTFKVHKKFTLFNNIYLAKAELLITKTDSVNIHRFNKHETVNENDVFIEKLGHYDENFWGEYNIIKPDESIEEALQKVDQKIRALNPKR